MPRSVAHKRHSAQGPAGSAALTSRGLKSAYASWAPVYDTVFDLPMSRGRSMAVRRLNKAGGRVLEVGVGTGLSLPLYGADVKVTGIDFSAAMLKRARERVKRRGLGNIEALIEMDAMAMAFPDDSFDATVGMYLMTAVPDPDKVFAELVRVTKPGGSILVVNHFRAAKGGPWAPVERCISPLSPKLGWDVEMTAERFTDYPGLTVLENRLVPPLGLFTLLHFRKAEAVATVQPAPAAIGAAVA